MKPLFPVKEAVASTRKKSKSEEVEVYSLAARHACRSPRAEDRADEAAPSNKSGSARVRRRSGGGLDAGWNGNHFYIRKARWFKVDPNGYFQFTYRGHVGPDAPNNDFVVRRAVVGADGTIGRRYDFGISVEVSDRKAPIHSADVTINYKPAFQLKVGRFKEPFSREALVSSRYREFAERAMINNLVPGDGSGVMAQGLVFGHTVQYQAGFFGGKGILGEKDSITPDGVVRLSFAPWLKSRSGYLRRMTFGTAFADGRASHGDGFAGSTPSGGFAFFAPEPVKGKVVRVNGEWTWLMGSAGFHAEYVQTQQDRQGLGPEGGNLPSVLAKGYYASATYLITGEKRVDNDQPIPHSPVFGRSGKGLGAWELKFRYSTLHMSDGTESNQVDTLTPGLNWYLTHFIRILVDLNVEQLSKPVDVPAARQPGTLFSALVTAQFRF